jgi:hypothetical protein
VRVRALIVCFLFVAALIVGCEQDPELVEPVLFDDDTPAEGPEEAGPPALQAETTTADGSPGTR